MANLLSSPAEEGFIRGRPCGRHCADRAASWVLAATVLGSGMAIVDGTAVNVALPTMQTELGGSVSDMQWVVEAYALCLAALILVGGTLGDHYGRRRVFSIGVALFAASSAWCGLAPDATMLIIARAVQGIGAALMVPGSLALLSSSFDEAQRGRAIGIWSSATAMTAALGPVLGGWLVETVSWRWIFFMNLPLAVVVLAITARYVPESREVRPAGGLDWVGALLVTAGLGGLVFGLIESANLGFGHPIVIVTLGAGLLLIGLFIWYESRVAAPMLPLDMFRSRAFTGANLLTLLLYAALSGGLFFLPFNLIQVQGYSPTEAGAALLPFVLLISVLSRWAGGLVPRFGARLPLTVGPLVAGIGFALFARPGIGGSYWTTFFPAVVCLGLGMAISVAPLTTAVMNAVPADRAGLASGINNAVARAGSLLAIAVLGIVALQSFNARLDLRLDELGAPVELRLQLDEERVKLAGAIVPGETEPGLRRAIEGAIAGSFVGGFRAVMLIAAGLAAASALSALFTIGDAPLRSGT